MYINKNEIENKKEEMFQNSFYILLECILHTAAAYMNVSHLCNFIAKIQ